MTATPQLAADVLAKLQTAYANSKPQMPELFSERKTRELRQEWNAPARHVAASVRLEGDWGAAYRKIESKLGTGILIALTGIRGSGKTQLAVELMCHVTGKCKRAYFVTATSFFMDIKATYRKDSKNGEADILARYQSPSLLVIDEIGKRSDSEWENNLLFELLNRRYNALKDTILIDNRAKADFVAAIGESLASRMNEGGGIIECNWKSFRS